MAKTKGKKIPNEIKKLQGTLEKSRVPDNPFVPDMFDGCPSAPDDLGDVGSLIWEGTVKELFEKGMLYNIDIPMIKIYCQEYENYQEAENELKAQGRVVKQTNTKGATNYVPSPWLTVKTKSWEVIKTLSLQFGLTPVSRNKIDIPEVKKEDPIGDLLRRKNGH